MAFNGWTFLFQLLNFVALAYILHRLLYGPLHAAIDQRRAANAKTQADAVAAQQQAAALQEQLEQQLADQEEKRQTAIREARAQAEKERGKLLAAAERRVEEQLKESRLAIERERDEAHKALHGEVIAHALALTQRLLREATDRTLHQQLALHLAEVLGQLSSVERDELRAQWQGGDGALLETAEELADPALAQVTQALTAALGTAVPLVVQVKPELLCGARLRVGGQVWDSSLAGQLHSVNGSAPKGSVP